MEWEPQRPSAPSTPSSLSSQSTGNSGARSDKIPTLKQISPSPSVSALSKHSDDDLRRKGLEDLLRFLRRVEGDYKSLLGEHGNIVKDVNRRFQIFVLETRSLKEVNQKLQDDNQELRDLCCFLDDDRQRGRKLAREWQRFGRYTASVMRSEVAVYQEKLRELEDRQSELMTENMELKELCLYLDQERSRMNGDRDEGDGSSNGTVTGQEDGVVAMETNGSSTPTPASTSISNHPRTTSSAANYIRELELKVHTLEEEKKVLAQRMDGTSTEGLNTNTSGEVSTLVDGDQSLHGSQQAAASLTKSPAGSKPEAVVHAMKVLQVHEELEKSLTQEEEDLDDPEKAIVREMCNVVWRKLGDVGDVGSFNESSDSILEPPSFVPASPGQPNSVVTSFPGMSVGHGQVHSFSVSHPQPQMSSTPLAAGAIPAPLGSKPAAPVVGQHQNDWAAGFPTTTPSYAFQPQQQNPSYPIRPLPDTTNQQSPLGQPTFTHGQFDARSEKSGFERTKETPDQAHPPYYMADTGNRLPQQPSHHQPLSPQQKFPPSSVAPATHHHPADPRQSQRPELNSQMARLPVQNYPPQPRHPPPVMPRHPTGRPVELGLYGTQLHSGELYPQRLDSALIANPASSQQQQRSVPGFVHPSVRLLDAPGSYNYSDGGGQQHQRSASNLQTNTPSRREGPREDLSSHSQPYSANRGENTFEDKNFKGRGNPVQSGPRSLSSSALSQPSQVPPQNVSNATSQQNLRGLTGFKAYPPQLSSMPNQTLSWRGSGRGQITQELPRNLYQQEPTPRPHGVSNQPSPPRSHGVSNQPSPRANPNPAVPTHGSRSVAPKRFQEQEWRQTYLDDSDTL